MYKKANVFTGGVQTVPAKVKNLRKRVLALERLNPRQRALTTASKICS
jgi:hypothetical protein